MVEKIDLAQTYTDIETAIKEEDHEKVLQLSEKILRIDGKEAEALQCKIISLTNLGRNDELISFIEKQNLQKEYTLEYAYALHEKKRYDESIKFLSNNKGTENAEAVDELIAQNFYKMGNYQDSYNIYKSLLEVKQKTDSNLDEDKDLISNFLAAYILSETNEEGILNSVTKYVNSWEAFYNYSIISIKQGKYLESLDTLIRMKRDYPTLDDEYNDMKSLNLNLTVRQHLLEGFDLAKVSNIAEQYETYFNLNKFPEIYPYFYNNFLNVKKERDNLNEIIRKFDSFIKNDTLNDKEKQNLVINRIILLLRANKIAEAQEQFKAANLSTKEPLPAIIYSYIIFKQEKLEKLEELIKTDENLNNRPEAHLVVLQLLLSSISSKTIEHFHLKVLNFVKRFYEFTLNYHFLNFFIGFYEARHLKEYLKEFIKNYRDPAGLIKSQQDAKKSITLLGKSFYSARMYEDSINFFSFALENFGKNDKETKLNLINALAHVDERKSDEIRKQVDETMIDLSVDHINTLLNEVFAKFKKNQTKSKKGKTKKKIKYPKNFDPKVPGPLPDPERWIPRLQRKKYRNINKNKMAAQGASADNTTTTNQYDKRR